MTTFFDKSRAAILSLTLFLFPLFFLPVTTEFYATNKQYLLVMSAGLLVLLATIELIGSKKIRREIKLFDIPVLLLAAAVGLSILLASPNKHAAAIAPVTGIVSIAALTVIYFFLSREKHESSLSSYTIILQYAVMIVCLIEIAVFILPYTSLTLPTSVPFLSSPLFSPLGSIVDLVAFLGFFFVYTGIRLFLSIGNRNVGLGEVLSFLIVTLSLALASITYFNTSHADLPYAPFEYSLRSIPIVLKNPLTAFFGYGADNFSALFTKSKDMAYATSPYGTIPSFTYARSAFLHILAETGIMGIFALCLVFFRGIYESFALPNQVKIASLGLFLYLMVAVFVFPPSLVLLFLVFITLGLLHHDIIAHSSRHQDPIRARHLHIPSAFSAATAVLLFCAMCWAGYQLAMYYVADVAFRRSARSIENHNLSQTYTDQFTAISLNPYQEKYRISFSQTNLYIANQIALNSKNTNSSLSQKDRSTVTNAIKISIEESRAATVLNPHKAANWENRGRIYKNLIGVAEKADIFAIGPFERAQMLDPYNPVYKNELGEVYYLTKQYKQATSLFASALGLKPDYTNARYNLAMSYYQTGQTQQAISEMERVLELLKDNPNSNEYKKARSDFERFKNALRKN